MLLLIHRKHKNAFHFDQYIFFYLKICFHVTYFLLIFFRPKNASLKIFLIQELLKNLFKIKLRDFFFSFSLKIKILIVLPEKLQEMHILLFVIMETRESSFELKEYIMLKITTFVLKMLFIF